MLKLPCASVASSSSAGVGLGNDRLLGGAGNDSLAGAGGLDLVSYAGATAGVTVNTMASATGNASVGIDLLSGIEAFEGTGFADTVTGANVADSLWGGGGNDNLNGRAGDDTLFGDAGDDVLTGGAGNDSMTGGAGNDTYDVDSAGDIVFELAGGGTKDLVNSAIDVALWSEVEQLMLTGVANLSGTGNASNNMLTGNAGNNSLLGLTGNDTLYGGAGNDSMDGGGDNDALYGGTGNNSLSGGLGDDTYWLDSATDVMLEGTDVGIDRVFVGAGASGVTLSDNIEIATVWGTGGRTITGGATDNSLTGGTGADLLASGGGLDSLNGGGGIDTFVFDQKLVAGNIMTIVDFEPGSDRISLSLTQFAAAGPAGPLAAGAFFAGTASHDADDRILYNAATGALMYDSDGLGDKDAKTFANLAPGLALTANDFLVA